MKWNWYEDEQQTPESTYKPPPPMESGGSGKSWWDWSTTPTLPDFDRDAWYNKSILEQFPGRLGEMGKYMTEQTQPYTEPWIKQGYEKIVQPLSSPLGIGSLAIGGVLGTLGKVVAMAPEAVAASRFASMAAPAARAYEAMAATPAGTLVGNVAKYGLGMAGAGFTGYTGGKALEEGKKFLQNPTNEQAAAVGGRVAETAIGAATTSGLLGAIRGRGIEVPARLGAIEAGPSFQDEIKAAQELAAARGTALQKARSNSPLTEYENKVLVDWITENDPTGPLQPPKIPTPDEVIAGLRNRPNEPYQAPSAFGQESPTAVGPGEIGQKIGSQFSNQPPVAPYVPKPGEQVPASRFSKNPYGPELPPPPAPELPIQRAQELLTGAEEMQRVGDTVGATNLRQQAFNSLKANGYNDWAAQIRKKFPWLQETLPPVDPNFNQGMGDPNLAGSQRYPRGPGGPEIPPPPPEIPPAPIGGPPKGPTPPLIPGMAAPGEPGIRIAGLSEALAKGKGSPDVIGQAPAPPVFKSPQAQNWAARMAELDARKAPDAAYRDIMSTAGKADLKRGETWRGKVQEGIDYFESRVKSEPVAEPTAEPPKPAQVGNVAAPPPPTRTRKPKAAPVVEAPPVAAVDPNVPRLRKGETLVAAAPEITPLSAEDLGKLRGTGYQRLRPGEAPLEADKIIGKTTDGSIIVEKRPGTRPVQQVITPEGEALKARITESLARVPTQAPTPENQAVFDKIKEAVEAAPKKKTRFKGTRKETAAVVEAAPVVEAPVIEEPAPRGKKSKFKGTRPETEAVVEAPIVEEPIVEKPKGKKSKFKGTREETVAPVVEEAPPALEAAVEEPPTKARPEYRSSDAQEVSDKIFDLDEAGAPDAAYRKIFPTKQEKLGLGETWRKRAASFRDFLEGQGGGDETGSIFPKGSARERSIERAQQLKELEENRIAREMTRPGGPERVAAWREKMSKEKASGRTPVGSRLESIFGSERGSIPIRSSNKPWTVSEVRQRRADTRRAVEEARIVEENERIARETGLSPQEIEARRKFGLKPRENLTKVLNAGDTSRQSQPEVGGRVPMSEKPKKTLKEIIQTAHNRRVARPISQVIESLELSPLDKEANVMERIYNNDPTVKKATDYFRKAQRMAREEGANYRSALQKLFEATPDEFEAVFGKEGTGKSEAQKYSFRKIFDDIKEGEAAGLTARYKTPSELASFLEHDIRGKMARSESWSDLERSGLIRRGEKPGANWEKVSDDLIPGQAKKVKGIDPKTGKERWYDESYYAEVGTHDQLKEFYGKGDTKLKMAADLLQFPKNIFFAGGVPWTPINKHYFNLMNRAFKKGGIEELKMFVQANKRDVGPVLRDMYRLANEGGMQSSAENKNIKSLGGEAGIKAIEKIPWVGKTAAKGVGVLQDIYERKLFKEKLPAFKAISGWKEVERGMAAGLTEDEAIKRAAKLQNVFYGGVSDTPEGWFSNWQNAKQLHRSGILAPDWQQTKAKLFGRELKALAGKEDPAYLESFKRGAKTSAFRKVAAGMAGAKVAADQFYPGTIPTGKQVESQTGVDRAIGIDLIGTSDELQRLPEMVQRAYKEGNPETLVKALTLNQVNLPIRSGWEYISGRSATNEPIWRFETKYGKQITVTNATLRWLNVASQNVTPPVLNALTRYAIGDYTLGQALAEAGETPVVYHYIDQIDATRGKSIFKNKLGNVGGKFKSKF